MDRFFFSIYLSVDKKQKRHKSTVTEKKVPYIGTSKCEDCCALSDICIQALA